MIVDFIIAVVVGVFIGFLTLFPSWQMPGSMDDFGASIGGSINAVNGVFPVVTLGVCLAAILGVHLFTAGFRVLVWLYDRIPFKAT